MGINLKTMISEVGKAKDEDRNGDGENLKTMFSDFEIPNMPPLIASVSWSKNMTIIQKCKDYLERIFYIKAARRFGWTHDVLVHNIRIGMTASIDLVIE